MLKKRNGSKLKPAKKTTTSKLNPRDLLSQLTEEIESRGVQFFEPKKNLNIDEEYLTLPNDITECDGQELGRYLNAFTQHRMYLRTVFGWQSIILEDKKRDYLKYSSPHYIDLSANRSLSETAKDKIINLKDDVYPYYEAYANEREKLNLVEVALNSVEDGIFLISREISRRNHDWDTENRNENVKKARKKSETGRTVS